MPDSTNDVVRANGTVRGTQSFVHVMASIFKRPGLLELEITWRALAWLPFYLPVSIALGALGMDIHFGFSGVAPSASSLDSLLANVARDAWVLAATPRLPIMLLACITFWAVLSAVGRSFVLRRLQPTLSTQAPTVISLSILRVWSLTLLLAVWLRAFSAIYGKFILSPEARGEYPGYVAGFALFTVFTLVLFMAWCVTSWIFPQATIFAMSQRLTFTQSLRAAWNQRVLRSKLIEINLVMGIVKVALLVLTLVFSACPLPFSNVETQTFLNWWWVGCFLFWVVSSDYFHVVRAAAVLRLAQAYDEA